MSGEKHARYEPQAPGRPLLIAAGVCGFILFTAVAMGALYLFYMPFAQKQPFKVTAFAPPRLEIDPSSELDRTDEAEAARIRRSGWIDRDRTRLAIPIGSAMKLVAGRGREAFAPLPNAPQAASDGRPPGAAAPAGRRPNPGAGGQGDAGR